MRLDAHQHFWAYDAAQYPWIPIRSPLQRDWLPSDLEPLLAASGIDGSIAVQARQTTEESHWLLTLADHYPFIRGVVGWVDLCDERVEAQLVRFAAHPRFVGVRHVLQDEPDDDFILRPSFLRGIGKLAPFKLTYDILIYPRHLTAAVKLVQAFPQQRFVLDHLAKPPIKSGTLSPWRENLRELGRFPNVLCKLSGLITEADHRAWKRTDFLPFLHVALETFGPDRLMFGSDWPVCLLAGRYEQTVDLVTKFLDSLEPRAQDAIFGDNARRFYLERA
jgi:L-fuconolactonase